MEELLNHAAWLQAFSTVAPDWLSTVTVLLVALGMALLLHAFLHRLLTRLAAPHELFWRSLVARSSVPLRLFLIVAAMAVAAPVASFTERQAEVFRHILLLGFILILMRVAQLALHIFMTVHLRRYKLDTDDNLLARKHVTQTRIMERVGNTLLLLVGFGAMLMTFETVRQYGVSLLASAGAAGIVVGLALQPLLKNLIAGIQLAITQPIRIDDALIVEGEYGNVEEITSTYVVVRTWDRRRMIIPLNYFMERPFQNWTREEAALIGVVLIYVDFSVPVPVLRDKVEEIVHASPLWDGQTLAVQVTDLRERTMEVRIIASAANAGNAFELRCDIRERLIAFLAENYPNALPHIRAELDGRLQPNGSGERTHHPDRNGGRT